jgi:hypothetical protein
VYWWLDSLCNNTFKGLRVDPNITKLKDLYEHLASAATPTIIVY